MSDEPSMRQLLQELQTLRREQREALKQASSANNNGVLSAALMLENTEAIVRMLPCLTEQAARVMLSSGNSRTRTTARQIVASLVPYLDQHWQRLEGEIAGLEIICGHVGKQCLDAALKGVNKERRSRGALQIATLDALMQQASNLAPGQVDNRTQEERDATVSGAYEEAINAAIDAAGLDPNQKTLGGMTLQDVNYLREVKQVIQQNWPSLANPMSGQQDRYYGTVVQLFEQARRQKMGPISAQRWYEAQRKGLPENVLIKMPNGSLRWGGKWGSKKETREGARTVAYQGPKQQVQTRVLTPKGELMFKNIRAAISAEFFGHPSPDSGTAEAIKVEAARERLMNTPEAEDPKDQLWRVDVSLERLGFEVEKTEYEVDAPDKPWMRAFGNGASINEMVQQLTALHQEKGIDVSIANTAHQIP